MKKYNEELLEQIFKKNKLSLKEVNHILSFSSDDSLMQMLFHFLNKKLEQYDTKKDIKYLENVINTMIEVVEDSTELDRKLIKRKTKKILEKIDRIRIENKFLLVLQDETVAYKELGILEEKIFQLDEVIHRKESIKYKIIQFIIEEKMDLDYVEKTFDHFPGSVNLKDRKGKSLFINIVEKYIELLTGNHMDKEELLYLNNIILLMKNRQDFTLNIKDKDKCLNLIYESLGIIKNKDEYTKNMLTQLEKIFMDEQEDKINFEDLLSKYNISVEFPHSIIEQLPIYQQDIYSNVYPSRIEIQDYIITIDSANALELDDGLSIRELENGNYLYGIHITDPLASMPYSSKIIQESIHRASAIYLKKQGRNINPDEKMIKIPLLPDDYSRKQGSLIKGEKRLAKSYYFELDRNGNLVNEQYFNTIITVKKRASYHEVDKVLEHGSFDYQFEHTLRLLDCLTEKIEKQFHPEDIYMYIKNAKKKRFGIENHSESRANKIVTIAMLFTGNHVANYFANSKEGYPTLYRTHEIDSKVIKSLESEIKNLSPVDHHSRFNQLYQVLLGIYPKAKYDIEGIHEGLGLKHYCHCTSPMRRAADIVVNHSLDVCYFSTPSDKEIQKLENQILSARDIINAKNQDIDLFIEDYTSVKKKMKK